MDVAKLLNRLRYYTVVIGFGTGAAIFWGALAAVITKIAFGLEEMHAWVFVGLPVAIMFMAWIWNKLPGLYGLDE